MISGRRGSAPWGRPTCEEAAMLKKLAGRRLTSTLGPLPPMIVAVLLLQVLFGAPLLAPKSD